MAKWSLERKDKDLEQSVSLSGFKYTHTHILQQSVVIFLRMNEEDDGDVDLQSSVHLSTASVFFPPLAFSRLVRICPLTTTTE